MVNPKVMTLSKSSKCPCRSGLKYRKCCGQYLKQGSIPLTAETLMRSRYTAYVSGNEEYLLNSWHNSTRPTELNLEQDASEWIKLEVLGVHAGKPKDNTATVEFIAHFKVQNQRQQLHEVSRFIKEEGRWFYLDGNVSNDTP